MSLAITQLHLKLLDSRLHVQNDMGLSDGCPTKRVSFSSQQETALLIMQGRGGPADKALTYKSECE